MPITSFPVPNWASDQYASNDKQTADGGKALLCKFEFIKWFESNGFACTGWIYLFRFPYLRTLLSLYYLNIRFGNSCESKQRVYRVPPTPPKKRRKSAFSHQIHSSRGREREYILEFQTNWILVPTHFAYKWKKMPINWRKCRSAVVTRNNNNNNNHKTVGINKLFFPFAKRSRFGCRKTVLNVRMLFLPTQNHCNAHQR